MYAELVSVVCEQFVRSFVQVLRTLRALHGPLCLFVCVHGCFSLGSTLAAEYSQTVPEPLGAHRELTSPTGQGQPIKSASEIAKKHLEDLGIAFSEESFLKAVSRGDLDVVKLFLAAGIRPTARDENGKTALVLASEKDHADVVRALIEAGADPTPLVEVIHGKAENRKDIWDKLTALSSLATVFASILVAAIGWYFTQAYNERQIENSALQNARDLNLKQQQNRLVELETIEKMIPHLTTGEESKRVALLAIKTLANPELATQMAQLYAGEGSVQALL
jgi:ankyrin repeat protein